MMIEHWKIYRIAVVSFGRRGVLLRWRAPLSSPPFPELHALRHPGHADGHACRRAQ